MRWTCFECGYQFVGESSLCDRCEKSKNKGNHNMTNKNNPNKEWHDDGYWEDVKKVCEEAGLDYDSVPERTQAMIRLDNGYEINSTEPSNEELKLCPFCGSKADSLYIEETDRQESYYIVSCENGDCDVSPHSVSYNSCEEAETAWQTRHNATRLASLNEENQRLKERVKELSHWRNK